MDIHEIRIANLQWLIDRYYPRRRARLARELGRRQNELWRLFSKDPGHHRNLGGDLARQIERQLGYPRGWLDQPHLFEEAPTHGLADPAGKKGAGAPKSVVVLNPAGHKCVAVLNYQQAAEWADADEPYPITGATETMWVLSNDLSPMAVGVRIEGGSMRELFYPGDIVLIDRRVEPVRGDYVGVKLRKTKTFVFAKYQPREADPRGRTAIALVPEDANFPTLSIDRANPGGIVGTMVIHLRLRRRTMREKSDPRRTSS